MSGFLQTLSQSRTIYVRQKIKAKKVAQAFGIETRNQYQIQTEEGQEFGFCVERNSGNADLLRRQVFGHWRVFNVVGTDMDSTQVFRAHHPFRKTFQRLDVYGVDNCLVGSLRQRFAWLNKKIEFLDANGQVIMTMATPTWKIWKFPVRKGEREVSVIERKWPGFSKARYSYADSFRILFADAGLSTDEKLLLLTSAIFIDILYAADLRLMVLIGAAPEAIIIFHVIRKLFE